MRAAILALVLAVAACGGTSTPSAQSSIFTSSTPKTSATPTGGEGPGPTAAASLSCELPVYQVGYQRTGFIKFPGGTFAADVTGDMVPLPQLPGRSPGLVRTLQQPELQGPGGPYYSRSTARWLPVQREAVAPDGRRYAYGEQTFNPPGSLIHVVNVATGVDKAFSEPATYSVIEFSAEGIYLQQWTYDTPVPGPPGPVGLAFIDPSGGAPKQIVQSNTIYWSLVEFGAAWGNTIEGTSLTRLDLKSGVVQTWLTGDRGGIVAVDAKGAPFVAEPLGTQQRLLLVPQPNSPQVISYGFMPGDVRVSHDSHGIWFGGPELNSVSLYTPQTGLLRMATLGHDPSQDYVWVAGECAKYVHPPSNAPTPSPCPALTSPPPSAAWQSFTDPQYGFTISYPLGFTVKPIPNGFFPATDHVLIAYRAADSCYDRSEPTGAISIDVYSKDADTLTAWVQKHSDNAHCLGGPGLFVFVTNLKHATTAGRDELSFDQDIIQCGEPTGNLVRHATVFFFSSGYVFVFEWQSLDANYAPTIQAIAEAMLASVTG